MFVTDWTVIQASHGLDVQSVTGIGHFLKSSNPSYGLDVQSVTRIGHFLKSSKPSHGLDFQSMIWIGCPIHDSRVSRIGRPIRNWDWMILKSVQSHSSIEHFLKSSKLIQSVT